MAGRYDLRGSLQAGFMLYEVTVFRLRDMCNIDTHNSLIIRDSPDKTKPCSVSTPNKPSNMFKNGYWQGINQAWISLGMSVG